MGKKRRAGPGRPKDPKSLRSLGVDRHAHPSKRFHAPQELLDRLAVYCRRAKVPEAQAIRESISEYLDRRQK